MRRAIIILAAVTLLFGSTSLVWADCGARVAEAQAAIKDAEAAVAKAKDSGKAAAKGLHAEAECKTDGVKDVRKNAESGREAREAQGFAEEAKMLADRL